MKQGVWEIISTYYSQTIETLEPGKVKVKSKRMDYGKIIFKEVMFMD